MLQAYNTTAFIICQYVFCNFSQLQIFLGISTWEQRKWCDTVDISTEMVDPTSGEYDDMPHIAPGNIESFTGRILDNVKSVKEEQLISGKFRFRPGDVVYGKINPQLGKYFYASVDGLTSADAYVFNGKNGVTQKFLFSLLQTEDFFKYSVSVSKRSGMPKINRDELNAYGFLAPKEEEQEQIGSFLLEIDNLITLHQRKLKHVKMMKKSMLQKMFPKKNQLYPEVRFPEFTDAWEQRKLGDLVINHNAGIYISKEDYGTGTNVIGVGNIYDNDIFDGEIYRLGPVNDEKFLLEENDLIYGESSLVPEGIARTVCVGKNGVGSAFAWHTRRVKLDQSVINSHFATLELNYNIDVRKYLISVSTQTALTGMTTEGYFGVTLSLPTVEEQAHISSLFKQLDHLITLHQRM